MGDPAFSVKCDRCQLRRHPGMVLLVGVEAVCVPCAEEVVGLRTQPPEDGGEA